MIGEVLLLIGALLTLASAVGMFRFGDVFTRMHALAKASTLAVVLMLVGAAIAMSHPNDVTSLLLATVLQVLTSPLASNMISFTTYREDGSEVTVTVLDDTTESVGTRSRSRGVPVFALAHPENAASPPPLRRVRMVVAAGADEASVRAAATAHELFGDGAEYLLVHVTEWDDPVPTADSAAAVARLAHLRWTESVTVAGEPARAVVRAAHDAGADLIVVGAHERSWFRRLFDPSVSRHVVEAADRPVLVVRETATMPTGPARLVVVATDGSAGSLEAARSARRFFGEAPRYEVVRVTPERAEPNEDATGTAGPLPDDAEADAIFREAASVAAASVAETARVIDAPHVSETVLFGDPATRLCEWAHEWAADVLVIAGTSTSGLLHALLGSVSEHVVAQADVPVLVVPAPR